MFNLVCFIFTYKINHRKNITASNGQNINFNWSASTVKLISVCDEKTWCI